MDAKSPHREPVRRRRERSRALADEFDGVVSRGLLRTVGVDHRMVRREVAAGRWALHGVQTVATVTGALGPLAHRWRAVWEVGADIAAVDGVTALQHAGMTGFDDDVVHVSVKHTAEVCPVDGVHLHKVVRRVDGELVAGGLPRTRPAVAAVRAAHWAVSDPQAALLLVMPVQQRLCTGAQLLDAVGRVRGRSRRAFVRQVVSDVADGAHSLGELDVAAACLRRGLPPPARQTVRRLPDGRAYLDLEWPEARLVVEVDGTGHLLALATSDDTLRQNSVALGASLVLRVGLLGWRLTPEAYLDQICAAYWHRVQRSA
ncbi:hypothetical protein [Phycicoccus sonneratiae]|uniref:DUF559 domain-containing protein n=1 Tax=Phycicoccus sonneratiae TaxID=2807628 RepID=A0ABS2CRR2_9MICO|nr:hypothetical protein [Phycicoccus sonneraticus]MBM6402525.1 hypothetical protein [Phycicoccus sonneraticus]